MHPLARIRAISHAARTAIRCISSNAAPVRPSLSVLIHGFSGLRLQLVPAATQLVSNGHSVLNFAYASRTAPLAENAASLLDAIALRKASLPPDTAINFVTHSFGGIVLASALREIAEEEVGRAVLIAPPARGCAFARVMAAGGGEMMPENLRPTVEQVAGLFLGKGVGQELGSLGEEWWTGCGDWCKLRGRALVVAGNVGRRNFFVHGDSDLIVQVEETVLGVSHWRVEHRLTHNALLYSPAVLGQVRDFLNGKDVGELHRGKGR